MKGFSKLPLALAVTSAVLLSGCLGGGGGGSSSSGSPATTTTVEGTAAKGIVLGGLVKAYEFGTDNLLSETTTSEVDGSYELPLPDNYKGTPILLVVSAADGTLMRCDLLICKDDGETVIAFGDDYPLSAGFELRAVVPGTTASTLQANVTALTTVAAALAQERSTSAVDANDVVLAANAQVANRFGLVGDLTAMKVADITNPETLDVSAAERRYNVMSAAVAGTVMANEAGMTPESALNAFVSQFGWEGIADTDPTDSTSLTLESILAQAAKLADAAGLPDAKADFLADAAKAATSGSTAPSQGEVPPDVGSEGLIATKQFVQQVRDLTNTAALEENLQGFADEVEMVSELSGDDLKASLSATGMALRAIAEAEEARQNGVTETQFDFDGVVVNRSGKLYTVKQVLAVNGLDIDVDINADVTYVNNIVNKDEIEAEDEWSEGGGTWQPVFPTSYSAASYSVDPETGSYSSKGDVEIRIAVSGTAASADARVTIAEGSLIDAEGSIDVTGTWSDKWVEYTTGGYDNGYEYIYEDTEDGTLLLSKLDTRLIVKLEQLATASVADPMSFTGKLDLNISNFGLTRSISDVSSGSSSYSWEDHHYFYESLDRDQIDSEIGVELEGLSLTVSGEFKNNRNSLLASASLQGDNINLSQTCYESEDFVYNTDGYYWSYDADCTIGENASGNLKLAVNFDLNLVGMSDPINVAVNARNQGMDSVIGDARLTYGGQSLHLDYQGGDKVTVKNHNDVVLTLEEKQTSNGDVLTGNIQWKGKEYATVDMELGAPTIRYSDGWNETL